ncbi:MAG: hypothetical protein AB8G22_09820 [Saprospiraceae bacterium]
MNRVHLLPIFFLFLLPIHLAAQDTIATERPETSLLDVLTQQELPELSIEMDFKMLFNDRRMMNYQKAMLSFTFSDGEVWADEVKVKTRGKFRSLNCDNPPLKIKYPKKALAARNLNDLNEFKLVYPCKSNKAYQRYVLKEYLVYKFYNLLTDNSLRVQLVNLSLKDSLQQIAPISAKGFLIEHREELIHRLGAKMSDVKCMRPVQISPHDYTIMQVFQFFIGNTDWLLPTCKNTEVISWEDGTMVPIPYDFDFSGMVNAVYATPDPIFGMGTITDRYFLGHKKKMEDLLPIFDLFKAKKAELLATVANFEYLPKSDRNQMIRYINSFYKILDNSKRMERVFVHPMAEEMMEDF